MVIRFKSNQTKKLHESIEDSNVKDIWLENFDGTADSVSRICKILGLEQEDITEAYIPYGITKICEEAFKYCIKNDIDYNNKM